MVREKAEAIEGRGKGRFRDEGSRRSTVQPQGPPLGPFFAGTVSLSSSIVFIDSVLDLVHCQRDGLFCSVCSSLCFTINTEFILFITLAPSSFPFLLLLYLKHISGELSAMPIKQEDIRENQKISELPQSPDMPDATPEQVIETAKKVMIDPKPSDFEQELASTVGTTVGKKKPRRRRPKSKRGHGKPTGFEEYYAEGPITPKEYEETRKLYDPWVYRSSCPRSS